MSIEIPILDLTQEVDEHLGRYMTAIERVVRSGRFIMGPEVAEFEREVAEYLGVAHAVGVNSGTDALVIALRAVGVGPGDEVITTPFTFFATAEAISQAGATPVFVDIDPETYNIDPKAVAAAVTERTRALLPVHLYGHAAEMDALMAVAAEHGLKVVEDVAQAFGGSYRGRKLGTIGDAGAFSFFPSKNLGGFGDGGLVVTNDAEVAEWARMLRVHGARRKYYNETIGYNSRLDTIQAAVLRERLQFIDEWNAGRRAVAARYRDLLAGVPGIELPRERPEVEHVYHQYTIRVTEGRRDAVKAALAGEGIGTMIYYPVPVHRLPVYADGAPTLPQAERAAAEVLSLPIWPQLDAARQERVATALRRALS